MGIADIFDSPNLLIWQGFLVFVRLSALTFFLPGFGEAYVPTRIKLMLAISLTLLVFPIIAQDLPITSSTTMRGRLIITEAAIGVFWGVIIRLTIFCLQMAGAMMSQAMSLAQIFGGSANMDAQPAMGHVLVISGIALFTMLGLHLTFLTFIINTYALSPAGSIPTGYAITLHSSELITRTFALAFQLAAAALTAAFLYNIVLGVINKAMPQLLVSFVGAPAITAGGLLILYIMAPTILEVWLEFVEMTVSDPGVAQ